MEGNKYLLQALGSGLWPIMVLLSEIVQTFILADFWCVLTCYVVADATAVHDLFCSIALSCVKSHRLRIIVHFTSQAAGR